MNYNKIYYDIIDKAKSENRTKDDDVYYELHHIAPRALFPELENCKWNKVLLTAREHFLCHLMLTKLEDPEQRNKMIVAASGMAYRNGLKINSRIYEMLKREHGKLMSINNPMRKDETRTKVSMTLKQKYKNENHPSKGYKHSDETKSKISEAAKGRIPWNKGKKYTTGKKRVQTEETKNKISNGMTEYLKKNKRTWSNETRRKMSESAKKRWEQQKNNQA